MDYDILIVGGGIAGMESALTTGDIGYSVLLVDKEPTIGGKMILLSKVFPTLDCASCIATPKMASTFHHPNVSTMANTEVKSITKNASGTFQVTINKKSTYVEYNKCTGCQKCEEACTVAIPDEYNYDMVARRAAFIPFPQAIPKKALIEKHGTSPCSFVCPAGIKAHGYVSLIRSGLFEEAMKLIMEVTPFPASLGRTCFAPCEKECTRGSLEGTVSIRRLKRFAADYYYERHPKPEFGPPEKQMDKKVAVVGSGPAGLTVAYHLAKRGYQVTIFEAEDEPGGMMRLTIPMYRLPKEILDRDIMNVTALGVDIKTGHKVESVADLKKEGYDSVFLACGAMQDSKMQIEGEDLEGVVGALEFLASVNRGNKIDLINKTVVIVGGGNVAIDAARVARRLGSKKVIIQYRRSRAEMPAFDWEIDEAIEEGVEFQYLKTPVKFFSNSGKLSEVESIDMQLGEPDASGRRRPEPIEGLESRMPVNLTITTIGQRPAIESFIKQDKLEVTRWNTFVVNSNTLETSIPGVFAGGDAVSGPATIVDAINTGVRAADNMDRFMKGVELPDIQFERYYDVVDKADVLNRQRHYKPVSPIPRNNLLPEERVRGFREVELPLSEEEARLSAGRCLDCGGCSDCQQCIKACPADAIDFTMRDSQESIEVGSVIVSTGFELFDPLKKVQYGFDRFPNVITAMQMDRLLSPTKPYNAVLRPSDGKIPDNIAYILCTGSRDCQVDNPLCSRVCCMYSVKQAQLIMGAVPLADITIYYIDIRAFGKGFEEFYQQAAAMGVYFVKGNVAMIDQTDNGNLILHYEDIANEGKLAQAEHDMVILSVGFMPNNEALRLFNNGELQADQHHYIKEVDEDMSPGKTSVDGVYVAGCAAAAMDIPDTILHAGASAVQAAAYVERIKR